MPNVLKSIKGYNVIQQFQKGTVQKELKKHIHTKTVQTLIAEVI